MCDGCGCGDREKVSLDLEMRILAANEARAEHNRRHFQESQVLAVNVMGSPGSGKTELLAATASALLGRRLAALAGDLETDHDARRLRAAGIRAASVNTGNLCHLDAELVHHALHELGGPPDVLFIENVGNLVCPAVYDLGQHVSVVALSVTEGEDKPLKYPVMFRKADLVLVTKADLLPHLEVSLPRLQDALARVMPEPRVIVTSARTGEGMAEWARWLEVQRERVIPALEAVGAWR